MLENKEGPGTAAIEMSQAVLGTAPLIPNSHRPPPNDYMSATNPLHPGAQYLQPPSDYISATDLSMQHQKLEQKYPQPPSNYLSATDLSIQQHQLEQQSRQPPSDYLSATDPLMQQQELQ